MGTVISELFEESGMSVQAFADKADLKYGTAYDIAKGISKVENIGAGAFVRIAHVFGKTADELLSDIPQDNDVSSFSNDEIELIGNYRKCNDIGKTSISKYAKAATEEFPVGKVIISLPLNNYSTAEDLYESIVEQCSQAIENGIPEDTIIKAIESLTDMFENDTVGEIKKIDAEKRIVDRIRTKENDE